MQPMLAKPCTSTDDVIATMTKQGEGMDQSVTRGLALQGGSKRMLVTCMWLAWVECLLVQGGRSLRSLSTMGSEHRSM